MTAYPQQAPVAGANGPAIPIITGRWKEGGDIPAGRCTHVVGCRFHPSGGSTLSNYQSVTPPMGTADAPQVVEAVPLTVPAPAMRASGTPTQTAPPTAPRIALAHDRITAQEAAKATGLGTVAGFTTMRHLLEEGFDPATGETLPIPDELRIPVLSTAQVQALPVAERARYVAAKEARSDWSRARCMRVPVWGGIALPGGEYRYSAELCAAWRERVLGSMSAA